MFSKSIFVTFPTETYYTCTINVVIDQLRVLLVGVVDPKRTAAIWNAWVETWSRFPIDGFLRSTRETIMQQIPANFRMGLEQLDMLLPWPEEAITAYEAFTYTKSLDASLVGSLRDIMGKWWSPEMHHIDGGMSRLPNAFQKQLSGNITLNFTVTEIEYESPPEDLHKRVIVRGFKEKPDGKRVPFTYTGHSVIVTTPINILRQIKIIPHTPTTRVGSSNPTPPMPKMFYKAIENISYAASTKIMLQCKTRFWEKEGIVGGFTKTNLPIGQLHYPSNTPKGGIKEGILLVYTWKSEALLFGALGNEKAVLEAKRQISEIHPEIEEEFEMGASKAWYSDPAQQGAYAVLKPRQEHNVRWLMYPWRNVYFAGEAISFASGWIQGALESGLRAAYQFYARNESSARS